MQPSTFWIRTAASAGWVQPRGTAALESSSPGVQNVRLSGKGSQAATYLLEVQQTGTVHVESARLSGDVGLHQRSAQAMTWSSVSEKSSDLFFMMLSRLGPGQDSWKLWALGDLMLWNYIKKQTWKNERLHIRFSNGVFLVALLNVTSLARSLGSNECQGSWQKVKCIVTDQLANAKGGERRNICLGVSYAWKGSH